ncbi:MAG: anthranilate phosphoribosyltransferase [Nitrospirales bacterium]|nr:anthranilate phosphoribosyltransferase [Nitrospirales bacterium]
MPILKDHIAKLVEGLDLSEHEAEEAMQEIMQGGATEAQIAAYLMGLRMKGETIDEITGSVRAMRERSLRIPITDPQVVDTCGTGGDKSHTFNISTASAFVVAGGGMTVAKHGNRSVSSQSGSADVLAALGVHIELSPEKVADCINEIGIGFLFAPLYHGAMKHCAKPRTELGIRTLMNIMGPLANPARATIQILGVYDHALSEKLAQVLLRLGTQHCFVLHGMDGLDEISLTSRTGIAEGKKGRVLSYSIGPEDFGLQPVSPKELLGGNPEDNAQIIRDIFRGRKGPKRDIVLMNAAPAFIACQKASTLKEGFEEAGRVVDNGAAFEKLDKLISLTKKLAA